MSNPSLFLTSHQDIPFNFNWGWSDFDAFWHDQSMPQELKGKDDPCLWSDEDKHRVDSQRDEWMALYKEWSLARTREF